MTDSINNNITETNVISAEKEERYEQKTPNEIKQENDEIAQENASLDDTEVAPVCNATNKQLTTCDAFVTSITQNYKSWVCMFVAIYFVSKPNLIEGYFTFGVMLLFSYYIHKETHAVRNFLTIAHHYHHEHNNFISNFVQILLEFQAGCGLNMLFHYLFDGRFFNTWAMMLSYLFYTSVHNINYSIYHVNHIHELHHKYQDTNMGPDICDIIGGTKNENMPSNEYIENTDHYILNIIVGAIIVLIIQNLYSNDSYKEIMDSIANYSLSTAAILIFIITTYIYIHDDGNKAEQLISSKN
jgi:hypothetical protein